jgi:hypothetical protein
METSYKNFIQTYINLIVETEAGGTIKGNAWYEGNTVNADDALPAIIV